MSTHEILREIASLRAQIANEPVGSPKIEDLTVALICWYEEFVKAMTPKDDFNGLKLVV